MAAPAPPLTVKRKPPDDTPAHKPYVPDDTKLPEFTWQAVVLGAVLGIIFGASSLYLVLKVGITVSASIPVAVLSITLFRAFAKAFKMRPASILENNIVQTTGSAGESIAFGVGVTMPALMLLGFDMTIGRVMVVSLLGGVLGILMMIPLRRAFIVRMHGELPYPEGTACASVLISGERGGTSGKLVFIGFGLAFMYKLLTEALGVLKLTTGTTWAAVTNATSSFSRIAAGAIELAPELLGVGFIIGIRTAAIMMAGAVVGNLVIAPAIAIFGDTSPTVFSTATMPIGQMELKHIQASFLRYIGAGCVAAAGIISMFRTLPVIVRSAAAGIRGMSASKDGAPAKPRRTQWDMSLRTVLLGCVALLVILALLLMTEVKPLAAVIGAGLVLLFGFLFVTVSSRLTGEIGSSSNPISGMTVATLALTCLIFLAMGWTSPTDRVLALSIAAVVCIAASNGGTTSQDLKTGYLVGGTPYWQQVAILIGALTSSLVIGGTLLLFNQAGVVYSEANLPQLVLTPEEYDSLTERASYAGTEYRVWRPVAEGSGGKKKKYLIGENRRPAWEEDAGVTGGIATRDTYHTDNLPTGRYRDRLGRTRDGLGNPQVETMVLRGGRYFVFRPDKQLDADVPPGTYLLDELGAVRFRVKEEEVTMKFPAPKTEVMGIVINGVLGESLNWGLVLVGALLAVGVELCGVSSLAFAVGVYIPMQYTSPIFIGGILSWLVGKFRKRGDDATAERLAATDHDSSPGVLLASGYVAGGTLAAVLTAFLEFSPWLKEKVNFKSLVSDTWVASDWFALLTFAMLGAVLYFVASRPSRNQRAEKNVEQSSR